MQDVLSVEVVMDDILLDAWSFFNNKQLKNRTTAVNVENQ